MKNKLLIGLLIGFTTVAVISGYWAHKTPPPNTTYSPQSVVLTPTSTANAQNVTNTSQPPSEVKIEPKKPLSETSSASLETTTSSPAFITAKMMVNNEEYQLRFKNGDKLADAMMMLTARSDKPFLFATKEYSGLGLLVTEINGQKNNPQTNEYWFYYINGQSATTGISKYVLKANDIITWKYKKSDF